MVELMTLDKAKVKAREEMSIPGFDLVLVDYTGDRKEYLFYSHEQKKCKLCWTKDHFKKLITSDGLLNIVTWIEFEVPADDVIVEVARRRIREEYDKYWANPKKASELTSVSKES